MITNPQSRADFAANREEWARACESNRYAQGRGRLRAVSGADKSTFCVLGIGCDVSGLGSWSEWSNANYLIPRFGESALVVYGNWSGAGESLLKLFGISFAQSVDLMIANDQGTPLPEIAEMIRALPMPKGVK